MNEEISLNDSRRNFLSKSGAVTLTTFLGLSGCITRPESVSDDTNLPPNSGFLIAEISSNISSGQLSVIDFTGAIDNTEIITENIKGPKFALKVREPAKLWVLPVPAGDYSWSRFSISNGIAFIRQVTRFQIAAGELNYVGSIDLTISGKSFLIRVLDREDAVRNILREQYPVLVKRHLFAKRLTTFLKS